MDEQEYQENMVNAVRYRMFRQIITGDERVQAQAQEAVAFVMRGQTQLTPALLDAAMDAVVKSFSEY